MQLWDEDIGADPNWEMNWHTGIAIGLLSLSPLWRFRIQPEFSRNSSFPGVLFSPADQLPLIAALLSLI